MMLENTTTAAARQEPADSNLSGMDDSALESAIAAQREAVAATERAVAQLRERFERQRARLRDLEGELERRRRAAAGLPEPEVAAKPARRKRSTTGMDALLGRDAIDQALPFSRFRLLSLQRQEVLLNHTGNRELQILGFVDKATGALLEAHTFGEARAFHEQGHALGWPGVPLQRQPIWYVADGKAGWLRLDQLFVEQDVEDN
jgi:uncharacterized coiled-coil protein SlyX